MYKIQKYAFQLFTVLDGQTMKHKQQ